MNQRSIMNACVALIVFANIQCAQQANQYPFINQNSLQLLAEYKNDTPLNTVLNRFIAFAHRESKPVAPETVKSFFKLGQHIINQLFLKNLNDTDTRRLFKAMGADIKTIDGKGYSCLFLTNKPEVLEELLDWGADVNNSLCPERITPLYFHCFRDTKQNIDAARVFLKRGANPEPMQSYSQSLIAKAVEDGSHQLVEQLCRHNTNLQRTGPSGKTLLIVATRKGSTKIVDILLSYGVYSNIPDSLGSYPLHEALPNKNSTNGPPKKIIPAIIASLLLYKANPNIPYPTGEKKYPLHRAAEIGNAEIVKKLLFYGAEKNYRNAQNQTALDLAQQLKLPEIIALLSDNTVQSLSQTLPVEPLQAETPQDPPTTPKRQPMPLPKPLPEPPPVPTQNKMEDFGMSFVEIANPQCLEESIIHTHESQERPCYMQ